MKNSFDKKAVKKVNSTETEDNYNFIECKEVKQKERLSNYYLVR